MQIELPDLYLQFRRTIEKSAWLLIFLIFLIEAFIAFIWISNAWLTGDDTPLRYCLLYVVLPTMINLLSVTGYHYIEYHTTLSEHSKNKLLIVTFAIICFAVCMVHNALHLISLSFILPIILSAVYGDALITRDTCWFSFGLFLVVAVNSYHYTTAPTVFFLLDYIAGGMIILASYLIAKSIIKYEQKNLQRMHEYNINQDRLFEEMKRDSLTRLYNHHTFYLLLEEKIKESNEHQVPLTLALLDIDNFKDVNDNYGHLRGDEVLKRLSQLLQNSCNEKILAARYGGEEFCLLLYDMSKEDAYATLEALRIAFEQEIFHEIGDRNVTFSAGMVQYQQCFDSSTMMLDIADEAMYEAKSKGKNQIVFAKEI